MVLTFESCGWNPKLWPFKWKLLSSTFLWCCLLCSTRWFYFWVCGWNPKVWPFEDSFSSVFVQNLPDKKLKCVQDSSRILVHWRNIELVNISLNFQNEQTITWLFQQKCNCKTSPSLDWKMPSVIDWHMSFNLRTPLPFSLHECVTVSNTNKRQLLCNGNHIIYVCWMYTCKCTRKTI